MRNNLMSPLDYLTTTEDALRLRFSPRQVSFVQVDDRVTITIDEAPINRSWEVEGLTNFDEHDFADAIQAWLDLLAHFPIKNPDDIVLNLRAAFPTVKWKLEGIEDQPDHIVVHALANGKPIKGICAKSAIHSLGAEFGKSAEQVVAESLIQTLHTALHHS